MRAFAKCRNCGHVMYTEHIGALLDLAGTMERYVCKECQRKLDCIQLVLCSRDLNQECEACDCRFHCFSSPIPIEAMQAS
jgi:hypothetical protein